MILNDLFAHHPINCGYVEAYESVAGRRTLSREQDIRGRLRREEDAVKEALPLWAERERTRAEMLTSIDEAEASLAGGEGRIITQQSMRDWPRKLNNAGEPASPRNNKRLTDGAHRRSPEADIDLDNIWPHIATKSGSADIADRLGGFNQIQILPSGQPSIFRSGLR